MKQGIAVAGSLLGFDDLLVFGVGAPAIAYEGSKYTLLYRASWKLIHHGKHHQTQGFFPRFAALEVQKDDFFHVFEASP